MLYFNVDEYTYTDINGNPWPVKEMREPQKFDRMRDVLIGPARAMDEIAARPEIFGDEGEMLAYKLYDANVPTLLERGFDLARFYSIKAPVE